MNIFDRLPRFVQNHWKLLYMLYVVGSACLNVLLLITLAGDAITFQCETLQLCAEPSSVGSSSYLDGKEENTADNPIARKRTLNNTLESLIGCSPDDCGNHGYCTPNTSGIWTCQCQDRYIDADTTLCGYRLKDQTILFLLAFAYGIIGVNWFWLARGNACYNCAGAAKLLTCGGCGLWWLIDWIMVLVQGSVTDGNGKPLYYNIADT